MLKTVEQLEKEFNKMCKTRLCKDCMCDKCGVDCFAYFVYTYFIKYLETVEDDRK